MIFNDKFKAQFWARVVAPLVAVAAGALLLAGAGLFAVTRNGDNLSIDRQTREARLKVSGSIDELASQQAIGAIWDMTARELAGPEPNLEWIDNNIGLWFQTMFGHDRVYVLNAADQPVYAAVDGQRVSPAGFEDIRPEMTHFVESVRGRRGGRSNRHERLPGVPLHPAASVRTSPRAVHATDIAWVAGRPAAVSVMRIMPHTEPVRKPGSEPLMVNIRYLDGELLRELSEQNLLESPRFSTRLDLRPGEHGFALTTAQGRLGYFIWRPELPGSELRLSIRAIGISVAAVMILMMAMLAHGLHRSMRKQHLARLDLEKALIELQASEAQAQHIAFHDVLTGLPNRAMFYERLEQALARIDSEGPVAVLLLDLDRFKNVNDTLGHAAGDALIREFGSRLTAVAGPDCMVARLGGDEFVLLVRGSVSTERVETLCRSILAAVHRPFEVAGNQAYVGVSIGVKVAAEQGVDRMEVMRKADIALYRAKEEGRDCYRLFEPSMDDTVKFRMLVEEDLRAALQSGEDLRVYFQPQVSAKNGAIVGLEALVRWQHPIRGLISPEHFIPVAEDAGLICTLGDWVLKEACAAARRWPNLFMAVNLSPVQFRTPYFAERLIGIVRDAGVSPAQIELEITESVLLLDDELVSASLTLLRQAGFRIALDDFGTGYSSLSYLRRFEVDKIKIDRSFVQHLGTLDTSAIVTAVVTLGHAMGLEVTAEGVETCEQQRFLADAGCDVMQGYLFSGPMPADRIEDRLRDKWRRRNAA